ncbi:MAG: hypothetical protein MMC33_003906 [Icmadophila ericetorum]|nr:hypothetical protein [Icmadophila ericetorum]
MNALTLWFKTRLASTSGNLSLEVFKRVLNAGIEESTFSIAQIICGTIFPIGAHGETKLNEALRALKEFSTIGNILWFGIGVKHPLRQMATTSGGASCVALIACLSEFYHNPPYCAKVLYEMARQSKGADDMLALQQWESLVKICCRVFASSTFGVQVQTLLKLTVYSPMAFSTEGYDDPANPAEILRLLG